MDIELKEKEEEKRKEEERRANIARKNCKSNKNLINLFIFYLQMSKKQRKPKKEPILHSVA